MNIWLLLLLFIWPWYYHHLIMSNSALINLSLHFYLLFLKCNIWIELFEYILLKVFIFIIFRLLVTFLLNWFRLVQSIMWCTEYFFHFNRTFYIVISSFIIDYDTHCKRLMFVYMWYFITAEQSFIDSIYLFSFCVQLLLYTTDICS